MTLGPKRPPVLLRVCRPRAEKHVTVTRREIPVHHSALDEMLQALCDVNAEADEVGEDDFLRGILHIRPQIAQLRPLVQKGIRVRLGAHAQQAENVSALDDNPRKVDFGEERVLRPHGVVPRHSRQLQRLHGRRHRTRAQRHVHAQHFTKVAVAHALRAREIDVLRGHLQALHLRRPRHHLDVRELLRRFALGRLGLRLRCLRRRPVCAAVRLARAAPAITAAPVPKHASSQACGNDDCRDHCARDGAPGGRPARRRRRYGHSHRGRHGGLGLAVHVRARESVRVRVARECHRVCEFALRRRVEGHAVAAANAGPANGQRRVVVLPPCTLR
eukprot:Opistho-1_new@25976